MGHSGMVHFHSQTLMEDIEATLTDMTGIMDAVDGSFAFQVKMRSFSFAKALMQEHFNENYVESDKFPNATFVGKVTNLEAIDFAKPGAYEAKVEGKLTIHGQTQAVSTIGTFEVKGDGIDGKSVFFVKLADYQISIPGAVTGKIAEEIEITVDIQLKPLK